jgi:hypothetical protein
MTKMKSYFIVTLIWVLIWGVLYTLDFYFENFLEILYAVISNLLFFCLYLMSLIVTNQLINKK